MAPTIHSTSLFTNAAATTTAIVNRGSGSDNDSDIPVRAGAGTGSRVRVAGSGRRSATHGSRTMILDPAETVEEDTHQGILALRGEPDNTQERRVQWDDAVIDNEHMNKKKSKICCIFKKQREFGESSDESSSDSDSSGSESDGGPVSFGGRGNGKGKEKRDAADGDDKDGACEHAGDPDHHHHHHRPKKSKKKTVNAYERAPKVSSTPKPVNTPNGSN